MSVKAAVILGLFILLAGLVRGGLYSAGHDFVVNRFTGQFQFVPAEDEGDGTSAPTTARAHGVRRGDVHRCAVSAP